MSQRKLAIAILTNNFNHFDSCIAAQCSQVALKAADAGLRRVELTDALNGFFWDLKVLSR